LGTRGTWEALSPWFPHPAKSANPLIAKMMPFLK